jgi:hypothetical protein
VLGGGREQDGGDAANSTNRGSANPRPLSHQEEAVLAFPNSEAVRKKCFPNTTSAVALGMLESYLKENRPINNQTIQGHIKTYCLQNGIISKEDFVKNLIQIYFVSLQIYSASKTNI